MMEDARAVFVHPRLGAALIRASPAGKYYALFEPGRFVLPFTRDGVTVRLPPGVPEARAISWSPGDRWTALAPARTFTCSRPSARMSS